MRLHSLDALNINAFNKTLVGSSIDLYPRYCRASSRHEQILSHHKKQNRNDSSCYCCHGLSEMNPKQRTNMVSIFRRWGALYPPLQTAHARRFVFPASTDWTSLCISGFTVPALVTDSSEFESVRSWAWAISTSSKEINSSITWSNWINTSSNWINTPIRRCFLVVVPYLKWHIIKARPPNRINAIFR